MIIHDQKNEAGEGQNKETKLALGSLGNGKKEKQENGSVININMRQNFAKQRETDKLSRN